MATDSEILEHQRALQDEADAAVAELGLDTALAVFGDRSAPAAPRSA